MLRFSDCQWRTEASALANYPVRMLSEKTALTNPGVSPMVDKVVSGWEMLGAKVWRGSQEELRGQAFSVHLSASAALAKSQADRVHDHADPSICTAIVEYTGGFSSPPARHLAVTQATCSSAEEAFGAWGTWMILGHDLCTPTTPKTQLRVFRVSACWGFPSESGV